MVDNFLMESDTFVSLTWFSCGPRPSPLGREDLLRVWGVRLGVLLPAGLLFTISTSQQAWSSFNVLFPALITLDGEETTRHMY